MDNLLAGQSAADTWRRRGKVKGQAIGRTVNCQGSIGIIRTQWNLVMGARKSYDGRTTVVARERGGSAQLGALRVGRRGAGRSIPTHYSLADHPREPLRLGPVLALDGGRGGRGARLQSRWQ